MKSTSLYIHIPFCTRKCLFCSFVVAIAQEHRRDEYVDALLQEAQYYKGRELRSIYLGGGTPTVLSDEQLIRLMQGIKENFSLSRDCEISVEANPEGIDQAKAEMLRELGVARVSLGVQSLDDRYLKFLGRVHDAASARNAFTILRKAGFDNINVDLMYGFAGQDEKELEEDVRALSALGSEHISVYTLTVEPNSRFFARQMKLDDEEKLADHFQLVVKLLAEHGLKQYEISNFAKLGHESRHNMNYWLGGEYIGLGVGAHGYLNSRRYWNVDRLQDYLTRINQAQAVIAGYEDLSPATQAVEKLLFGLRMNRGVGINDVPASKQKIIEQFIMDEFLVVQDDRLQATAQGQLVLDALSERIV